MPHLRPLPSFAWSNSASRDKAGDYCTLRFRVLSFKIFQRNSRMRALAFVCLYPPPLFFDYFPSPSSSSTTGFEGPEHPPRGARALSCSLFVFVFLYLSLSPSIPLPPSLPRSLLSLAPCVEALVNWEAVPVPVHAREHTKEIAPPLPLRFVSTSRNLGPRRSWRGWRGSRWRPVWRKREGREKKKEKKTSSKKVR